jgi:hypothetical protein
LTDDGRHVLPIDDQSWHLLLMDRRGSVAGCKRYLVHPASAHFRDLRIANSALAESAEWGPALRFAVESELVAARKLGFSYVEIGGWAMADHFRGTSECLRSMLASYAWLRLIGGALAISPATERNGSATILRRMGGRLLSWGDEAIPPYFDPHYGCRMQMLRFDSRTSIPRYEATVQEMMALLAATPVICTDIPEKQSQKVAIGTLRVPWHAPLAAAGPALHAAS